MFKILKYYPHANIKSRLQIWTDFYKIHNTLYILQIN